MQKRQMSSYALTPLDRKDAYSCTFFLTFSTVGKLSQKNFDAGCTHYFFINNIQLFLGKAKQDLLFANFCTLAPFLAYFFELFSIILFTKINILTFMWCETKRTEKYQVVLLVTTLVLSTTFFYIYFFPTLIP